MQILTTLSPQTKLSLVITNYNRTTLLIESFTNVIHDSRIDEILIVDDCSLREIFDYIDKETKSMSKVKLIRNNPNKGMALNKAYAISQSKNDWCIIFDSDNVIKSDYIDAFYTLKELSENCIYMPSKALPKYDFTKHQGFYFGANYISETIMKDNSLNVCMNTCNYIVNKNYYAKSFVHNVNVRGVDTVWHALKHLESGGIFYVVPQMEYYHRTHDGSEFMKDLDYNMKFGSVIRSQLTTLNKNGMVTCRLKGRFGNHLFTIAATIAHALENGMDWHIPEDLYFKNLFNYSYNPNMDRRIVRERQHNYHKITLPNKKENMILDGHYQSERYFSKYREDILKIFNFKPIKSDYVAIHVRRGDYLTMPTQFPFVGLDYINRAINYFKSKGENKFMVFGDDVEWNVKNIKSDGCEFIFRNGDMMQDFLEMAGCKSHIISNSTFSWWAAWIADGETVAPKIWFGHGNRHLDTSDVIPTRWIKL